MLNKKKRAFVDSVAAGETLSLAYEKVYKIGKISRLQLEKKAQDLFGQQEVQDYLESIKNAACPAVQEGIITPSDVLRELSKIALYPIELTGSTGAVKFADKQRALELLGKYLGIFKDKTEEKNKNTVILLGWENDEQ